MKRLTLTALLSFAALAGCTLFQPGRSTGSATANNSPANAEQTQCASHLRALERSAITAPSGPSATPTPGHSLDALYWCTKGAEKGDARSQFMLAGMYEKGLGVPKNQPEALRWYKESAKRGDSEAQMRVGQIYGRGEGVPQDKHEATRWYAKAAEQGNAEAQFYMGYRYQHGKGIAQNHAEALRWYTKAADQGHASALNYLGVMSQAGQGQPQNNVEAYKWFNLAAASGEKEYIDNRDRIAKKLSAAQLAEGQRLASEWAKTHPAIKKGNPP